MRAEVLRFCRQEALFAPGARVLCAVSGGADSMAMLWCLYSFRQELGITVSAAHFNHLLRSEASDADEAFVRDFCAKHQIPFFSERGDVAAYAVEQGIGIEEAARELRYRYLLLLPSDHLATAHHAEDNAETVLLHLLRGSGLRGLRGMLPRQGSIVRPLLSVTKEQIMEFLRQENIPWREDGSNEEDFCRRNRLRHHVLPLLKQEEPKIFEKLTAQSELLRAEDEFLDRLARELLKKAEREDGYDCKTLLGAEDVLQKRALRLMTRKALPKDVSSRHIEAMQGLLSAPSPSAEISLPGGYYARRFYESITITRKIPRDFSERVLKIPGQTEISELGIKISCVRTENFEKNTNTPFQFAVKYDMISQSILCVRPRREGDRIKMADGHSKSLKKLLIERKIPRIYRQSMPVIAVGGEILAIGWPGGLNSRYAAREGEPALIIDIIETEKKET